MKKFITLTAATLCLTAVSMPSLSQVNIQKRNTGFSFDSGGSNVSNGKQIKFWNTNKNNRNQQFTETSKDSKYTIFKNVASGKCIDGGNGGSRNQKVVLWTCSNGNKNQHWEKKNSAGGSKGLQKRNTRFSIDSGGGARRGQLMKLWNSNTGNGNQQFIISGSGSSSSSSSSSSTSSSSSSSSSSSGSFGLDKNKKPWQNFDLKDWALDTPEKDSDDGLALRTSDKDFANGNVSSKQNKWFSTHSDGGMRFTSFAKGAKTSPGTKFTRSELREMLRRGNTSIDTKGETKNNWQMGYATTNSKLNGKNGKLTATLRVNRVTRQGDTGQRGRVIVGQIHASKNEPVRLYYRKLPNNSKGSVYWAHEDRDGDEKYHEIIGSRSSSQSNPSKGFALNELWSYEIINSGKNLEVIIRKGDRNGSIVARNKIDMDRENSGYDRKSEWMYFKAGAYTQNDSSNSSSDTDIVTFYRLANSH